LENNSEGSIFSVVYNDTLFDPPYHKKESFKASRRQSDRLRVYDTSTTLKITREAEKTSSLIIEKFIVESQHSVIAVYASSL
jgi:hypothetical protein